MVKTSRPQGPSQQDIVLRSLLLNPKRFQFKELETGSNHDPLTGY